MDFIHDKFPGYRPGKPVPLKHITSVIGGPTSVFWKICLKYIKRMNRNCQYQEANRVMGIVLTAHATFHLGMSALEIIDCGEDAGENIFNQIDRLLRVSDKDLLFQIDCIICKSQPATFLSKPERVSSGEKTNPDKTRRNS